MFVQSCHQIYIFLFHTWKGLTSAALDVPFELFLKKIPFKKNMGHFLQ
jgi:hypothetical protein